MTFARLTLYGCLLLALWQGPLLRGEVRALLIGISDYPREVGPKFPSMEGPANDVLAMQGGLMEQFNVPEANIKALPEEEATTAGIQQAIERYLVPGIDADDTVFLFFAGHGTQMPDLGPVMDEPDGFDEVLVTRDFREMEESTWLTDDRLHTSLSRIPAGRVIVIFDCCHSGTGTRGGGSPFEWSLAAATPDTSMREQEAPANQIFIAACDDGELAHASYDNIVEGQLGVFTRTFRNLMREGQGLGDLDQLQETLRERVNRNVRLLSPTFFQNPVVEAAERKEGLATLLTAPVLMAEAKPRVSSAFDSAEDIGVTISTAKNHYVWTETLSAEITMDRDAYLRVFYVDVTGEKAQIYPNKYQPMELVPKGQSVVVPPLPKEGQPGFQIRFGPPKNTGNIPPAKREGLEMLVAVACNRPFTDKEALDFSDSILNDLPEDVSLAEATSRGIDVVPRNDGGAGPQPLAYGRDTKIFRVTQFRD